MKVSAVFLYICSAILTDSPFRSKILSPCSLLLFIGQEFGMSEYPLPLPCVHRVSADTYLRPTAK